MVKLIAVDLDGTLFTSEGVAESQGLEVLSLINS
jgi:hydroxymethylpyrimidine pyrophosphatase-like HAD family hydrolase